jgi:pSer/pThr/pTyr-binding forkhead associated (FHA) protein
MRIYTIGRSSKSDIVINQPQVSGNHAELLQLDNGDILLVDKNSSNGTYVNGVRIKPESEVTVRRGDDVWFADVTLNWSSIPTFIPDPNIKVLKSIGSHSQNSIKVNSPSVSRFHASIKQTKDNKWYICDHSSNGTTLNGKRIPSDQWISLKSKDIIECAGFAVQNPVPSNLTGKAIGLICGIVAVVAAVVALVLIQPWTEKVVLRADVNKDGKVTHDEIYATYANSTSTILMFYYYSVSVPELPEMPTLKYVWDTDVKEPVLYDGNNEMIGAGTGFFIAENGVLVTNLHIAKPWLFEDNEIQKLIKLLYIDIIKDSHDIQLSMSDVKADGKMEYICAIPNGKIFDKTNAIKCRLVSASDSKDVDLAILQTMNDKLPEGSTYIPISEINPELTPIGTSLFTMGFPAPTLLQDWGLNGDVKRTLQANAAAGVVTSNNEKYTYGFDAVSYTGASGSPIFDQEGHLIGVVSAKAINNQNYNLGIKAKYINILLTEAQE